MGMPIQQKQATNSMGITGREKSKKRSVWKNVPKANVNSTSPLSKAQQRKLRIQKEKWKSVTLSKAQKRKLRMKNKKNGNQSRSNRNFIKPSVEKNEEKLS